MNIKRIIITGVAGFIGSNLAERLLNVNGPNLKIIGIDNLSYGVKEQVPEGVEFHQLDIRSNSIYPLFHGVDYVFHLAAKNCISDCQNDPVETADINVTGTINVFEAAIRAKVKKIIYAESSAMYEGSSVFPTPESEIKAESIYAVSKLSIMHFAKAYQRFYDLSFTALRYFCVYGPRQDYRRTIPPVMCAFIIKLLKGVHPIIYGTGEKSRDFVHIDDVNDFHIMCINDRRTDGKVYNIGTGTSYSVLDIYKLVSEILDIYITPVFEPDLPGEAQETLADINQAKEIGWQPQVNIISGIKGLTKYIKSEIRFREF